MKDVWGVQVDERDYELVLKIAGLLYGRSEFGYEKGRSAHDQFHGKKKLAGIALKAVEEAKKV